MADAFVTDSHTPRGVERSRPDASLDAAELLPALKKQSKQRREVELKHAVAAGRCSPFPNFRCGVIATHMTGV
jgi:hypothetical protein